jgi:hypothetical protein
LPIKLPINNGPNFASAAATVFAPARKEAVNLKYKPAKRKRQGFKYPLASQLIF